MISKFFKWIAGLLFEEKLPYPIYEMQEPFTVYKETTTEVIKPKKKEEAPVKKYYSWGEMWHLCESLAAKYKLNDEKRQQLYQHGSKLIFHYKEHVSAEDWNTMFIPDMDAYAQKLSVPDDRYGDFLDNLKKSFPEIPEKFWTAQKERAKKLGKSKADFSNFCDYIHTVVSAMMRQPKGFVKTDKDVYALIKRLAEDTHADADTTQKAITFGEVWKKEHPQGERNRHDWNAFVSMITDFFNRRSKVIVSHTEILLHKNQPRWCTMAYIMRHHPNSDLLKVAVAICNPKDAFCKRIGRSYAVRRLAKKPIWLTRREVMERAIEIWFTEYSGKYKIEMGKGWMTECRLEEIPRNILTAAVFDCIADRLEECMPEKPKKEQEVAKTEEKKELKKEAPKAWTLKQNDCVPPVTPMFPSTEFFKKLDNPEKWAEVLKKQGYEVNTKVDDNGNWVVNASK